MVVPYDVLVSREVKEFMSREADEQAWLDFNEAIESIMRDSTENNPRVVRVSQGYGYDLNEFAVGYGVVTLIFEPMNLDVVEVISVALRPRP